MSPESHPSIGRAALPLIVLGIALGAGMAPARGATPGVLDAAGLFAPEAVQKADDALGQLERQTHWQVVIETIPHLDGQDVVELTHHNFQMEQPSGLYVLIAAREHKIETQASPQLNKVFTDEQRRQLRGELITAFRARHFDQGLLDAVKFLRQALADHPGPAAGPAPSADLAQLKAVLDQAERTVAHLPSGATRRPLESELRLIRRITDHLQASPAAGAAPAAPAAAKGTTDRDQQFARFVTQTAGPLVKAVSVKLDREGRLGVEISNQVKPEDLLDLTRALLAGARKQFPDKPISIMMFDPMGAAILTAHFQPGKGVSYDLAKDASEPGARPVAGATPADTRFAESARSKAAQFLRFVNADLEHNGRLWVGITPAVAPGDLNALTDALLAGARKDFPNRSVAITVFDPEGKRVGTKTFDVETGKTTWHE